MTKEEIISELKTRMEYYADEAYKYSYCELEEQQTRMDLYLHDIYEFVAHDYLLVLKKIEREEA